MQICWILLFLPNCIAAPHQSGCIALVACSKFACKTLCNWGLNVFKRCFRPMPHYALWLCLVLFTSLMLLHLHCGLWLRRCPQQLFGCYTLWMLPLVAHWVYGFNSCTFGCYDLWMLYCLQRTVEMASTVVRMLHILFECYIYCLDATYTL